MLLFINKIKDFLLDILFPPICLVCQKPLEKNQLIICQNCIEKIKLNTSLFCPICGARLAENKKICHHRIRINNNSPQAKIENLIEPHSTQKRKNFYYLLGAAGNYDDPALQVLIRLFKYKNFKNLAPFLSDLLINYLKICGINPDGKIKNFILVPIPLYFTRERKRGFNQAKLIAKNLSKKLNLELSEPLLRIKNTTSQAQTENIEDRMRNVKDCFKLKNSEAVRNKNIILVDDVFTSGATMNEAVKILKQNGAKKILALVLAKA